MNLTESCPIVFEPPVMEDDMIFVHSSSEGSLSNSLSSELSSDSEDLVGPVCNCTFDDCNDVFASLDAEYEKHALKPNVSYNGLYHCSYSVCEPFMFQDCCPMTTDQSELMLSSNGVQPLNSPLSCSAFSPNSCKDAVEQPRVWY